MNHPPMTDSTSSVRVSRFLRSDDDQTIVGMIHEGMWLRVQGKINYSKYDEDMVLEPRNIVQGEKVIRPDNAPQKRVELHLHTRMSNMDALTDTAAVVTGARKRRSRKKSPCPMPRRCGR